MFAIRCKKCSGCASTRRLQCDTECAESCALSHPRCAVGNAAWRPCLWHVVAPGRRKSAKGSEPRLQRRRRLHAGRQSEQGSGGGAGGLSMHCAHGQIRRREAPADWRGVMRCCKLTSSNRRQFEFELPNRASCRAVMFSFARFRTFLHWHHMGACAEPP